MDAEELASARRLCEAATPMEKIQRALDCAHARAIGDYERASHLGPYMSIPARPGHDADLVLTDALMELAQHRTLLPAALDALAAKQSECDALARERDALSDMVSMAEEMLPDGYRVDVEHNLAECVAGLVESRLAMLKADALKTEKHRVDLRRETLWAREEEAERKAMEAWILENASGAQAQDAFRKAREARQAVTGER